MGTGWGWERLAAAMKPPASRRTWHAFLRRLLGRAAAWPLPLPRGGGKGGSELESSESVKCTRPPEVPAESLSEKKLGDPAPSDIGEGSSLSASSAQEWREGEPFSICDD